MGNEPFSISVYFLVSYFSLPLFSSIVILFPLLSSFAFKFFHLYWSLPSQNSKFCSNPKFIYFFFFPTVPFSCDILNYSSVEKSRHMLSVCYRAPFLPSISPWAVLFILILCWVISPFTSTLPKDRSNSCLRWAVFTSVLVIGPVLNLSFFLPLSKRSKSSLFCMRLTINALVNLSLSLLKDLKAYAKLERVVKISYQ